VINPAADTSDIERARRKIGQAGFAVAAAALVAGIVCSLAGARAIAAGILQVAFGVLLLMPAKNVIAVLADEVRRRDWWFVLLAAGVVAELGFVVWDRIR